MIASDPAQEAFISEHRWAVLTSLRRDGQPVSSLVAYARDGDTLIVSTPGSTFKRRSLARDPRVTLTVLSNQEPFNFVAVEGHASVETEDLVDGTRLIFANIAETGFDEPEDLPGWLEAQQRVLIRIHPERCTGVIR